jgi:hypothetical protein
MVDLTADQIVGHLQQMPSKFAFLNSRYFSTQMDEILTAVDK